MKPKEFEPEEDPAEGRSKSKPLVWDTAGMSTKQIFMEEVSTKQRRIASFRGIIERNFNLRSRMR